MGNKEEQQQEDAPMERAFWRAARATRVGKRLGSIVVDLAPLMILCGACVRRPVCVTHIRTESSSVKTRWYGASFIDGRYHVEVHDAADCLARGYM